MSKKYDDVKRAAEAALKGLIKENLKDEEVDQLLIELSMSLFAASFDFNLPYDKFAAELSHRLVLYTIEFTNTIVDLKCALDAGEDDDSEEI